ncbi:MAG: N-acetyltransferase family protein [Thermoleophilia bacterium]
MRARPATAEDASAFALVVAEVAQEGRWIATEPPVDVIRRAALVRDWIARGDGLFVLEDDGARIVGCLGLHQLPVAGVVSLGMCIVADARGRGGGRALMEAALGWLRDSEMHKVELEVWPDNERAIALYESYGFELEGVRRDHYRRRDGSLRSSVIMARLLHRERDS